MNPIPGQLITIVFKNSIQLTGKIIEWSEQRKILKSLNKVSTIVLPNDLEEVLFYQFNSAPEEYQKSKTKINKTPEDLEELAELQKELKLIEQEELKQKLSLPTHPIIFKSTNMDQSFQHSKILNNIPIKKFLEQVRILLESCQVCSKKNLKIGEHAINGLCEKCHWKVIAYNRYLEGNIPITYWNLDMTEFKGEEGLKKVYETVASETEKFYQSGMSFCLSGSHGNGKTTCLTAILKKVACKNYSIQYTTLSDMVDGLVSAPFDEQIIVKKELAMVDFLVVDEYDNRYIGNSEASVDLFGRTFERILRNREENKLPILFATNSPNIDQFFEGSLKASIKSLMSKVKIIPVMGKDVR